jgi:hypothetical protein
MESIRFFHFELEGVACGSVCLFHHEWSAIIDMITNEGIPR